MAATLVIFWALLGSATATVYYTTAQSGPCGGITVSIPPPSSNVSDYAPVIRGALRLVSKHGHGSVLLSRGTYDLRSRLDVGAHTCIVGAGTWDTVLRKTSGRRALVSARNAKGISLKSLTLDANGARYALLMSGSDYASVSGIAALNAKVAGIRLRGLNGNNMKHATLIDCITRNNGGGQRLGDGVRLGCVENVTLLRVTVEGNERHGVRIDRMSRDVLLRNCSISQSGRDPRGGCGLSVDGAAQIEKGTIEESFKAGVCVGRKADVNLTSVKIINTGAAVCIDAANGAKVNVEDGYCKTIDGVFLGVGPTIGWCEEGIRRRDVCCPALCGSCGGPRCQQREGGEMCCYSKIKKLGRSCDRHTPPCVLQGVV